MNRKNSSGASMKAYSWNMAVDQRIIALIGLVLLASFVGLCVISISGRARRINKGETVQPSKIGATKNGQPVTKLGEKVTLLQFSSDFCSSCKQTSALLAKIEKSQKGLLHIDLDITDRLDLAKTYSILQTPTILILNSRGEVVSRIAGTPKQATIESEIERLISDDSKQN
jgi:thiol-disulfide isomerase/thioredoxin